MKRELHIPCISEVVALGADRGLPFMVRTAGAGDLRFIDSLQKKYGNEVGFLPLSALEAYVGRNCISIGFENDEPAGYILGKPCYKGDAELAILYQCAIDYSAQRRLLGSSLVEHALGLLPPPTKLAAGWVAQDIEANYFWEAIGFAPVAARRGSKRKGRVHIFWQRAIDPRKGRAEARLPNSTSGGLMREKRIVLPIEDGQQWQEFSPEDFPEPPAGVAKDRSGGRGSGRGKSGGSRESVEALRRRFMYGISDWMWVIINGVGRYLPVVAELEVPEFMDLPGKVVVGVESAGVPRSRIPGL